jgi:hypothetical protein
MSRQDAPQPGRGPAEAIRAAAKQKRSDRGSAAVRGAVQQGPGGDRGFAQPTDKHRGGSKHVPPQLRDERIP